VDVDLKEKLLKKHKISFKKSKSISIQVSGFDGLLNLTALSVDHAIPRFVNGTLVPFNDNVNVSKIIILIKKTRFKKNANH
jgi:hypothetical protein